MSKASEWARRAVQIQTTQPKFECASESEYDLDDGKATELVTVAIVKPTMRLKLVGSIISPGDARALARWILDTFDDAPGAEPPRP